MKISTLCIGTLALALSFSACQNNASKTETDHSSMDMSDSSQMNMDSTATSSGIMGAMDKMMKDMHQMEMTGNADYDLISMLKSHHQGAIDMAKVELESGTEPKLKQIAQNMVDKQSKEIQMLDDMLKSADKSKKDYEPSDKNSGLGKDMDANMMKMMEMDHGTPGSVDHEFASMMIKHHKDGIDMGNIIVKHSKMAEFKSMAQKMIDDQTKEIAELETAMSQH
ncbi:MAG: DUF305 domain-containing protein [Bacteroidota bacterium]